MAKKKDALPADVQGPAKELLEAVFDMERMTQGQAWQGLYRRLRQAREDHARACLNPEISTAEIRNHQQWNVVVKEILAMVKAPVEEFTALQEQYPLFAQKEKSRASWDGEKGCVVVTEAKE